MSIDDGKLEKPLHQMAVLSSEWPSGLKTLEDAARDLGIGSDRLGALADGGFAPHFRIDGGPALFRISELKRWSGVNLIERIEGRDLPAPIRVIVSAQNVQDFRKVPVSLREIAGLCDITDETLRTGVYFLCRDGALLYVGQSVNVSSRCAEHHRNYEFDTALFLPWPRDDLNRIEAALIRALRPPLNGKSVNGTIRTSFGNKEHDATVIATLTNAPHEAATGNLSGEIAHESMVPPTPKIEGQW